MKLTKYIILACLCLFIVFINCSRKAELLDFQNTGTVIDATNALIEKDTVWKDLFGGDTIDYYVTSLVRIKNALLTIKPGVRISFEDTLSGIRVEGTGGLDVEGSANNRIVFTTRNQQSQSWIGVIFASDNPKNKISFATIEYAGSRADSDYCDKPAAIGIAKNVNAKASVTDCIILYCGGYGIWVAGSGDTDIELKRNDISAVDIPIGITADNMSKIDSSNNIQIYLGYIDVYGSSSEIKNTDTIQNPKTPYRITGKVFVTKNLVISLGCTFEFAAHGELVTCDPSGVNHTGMIKAIGTSAKPITFKPSVVGTNWVGITLTSNNDNQFTYCNISGAGGTSAFANPSSAKGNFVVGHTATAAKATITYCTISGSGGFGIAKYSASAVTTKILRLISGSWVFVETNTYSQNNSGDIGTY